MRLSARGTVKASVLWVDYPALIVNWLTSPEAPGTASTKFICKNGDNYDCHHFGTDEIPRQCVTPGDYVLMKVGHISPRQTILKSENFIS